MSMKKWGVFDPRIISENEKKKSGEGKNFELRILKFLIQLGKFLTRKDENSWS